MGSEAFNRDLEMVNAGCFSPESPLTTTFLLIFGNNPCPLFYGKVEDKKKVYQALKETIHQEVHAVFGATTDKFHNGIAAQFICKLS